MEQSLNSIRGKRLLIDGDLIQHSVAYAIDGNKENGECVPEYTSLVVESIRRTCEPTSFQIFLSGEGNFRYGLSPDFAYKKSREGKPKPKCLGLVGKYLEDTYGATRTKGYEADDALGIGLTTDPNGRVCVGYDKDLLQVSGWHYDYRNRKVRWISRKSGDFKLYTQVLAGDSTDSIPGIRGVGPEKAKKLLAGATSSRDLCQRAWEAYRVAGYSKEYFTANFRSVYILRRYDDILPSAYYQIDYNKKKETNDSGITGEGGRENSQAMDQGTCRISSNEASSLPKAS